MCLPHSNQLAHYHWSGGNADPYLQCKVRSRPKTADTPDDVKRGADRPLGVVLVRLGPSEVGKHPIAHELGDMTLEPVHHPADTIVVGAEDVTQLFGVQVP